MEISGLISAVIIGIVIGVLGRLVVPGRQHIGVIVTILVGIVAALLGTAIAAALGVANTDGPDWIEWLIQIALAAVGIAALDRTVGRRR
ncbi:GlsB/YeaQ/YmgE family stress response membrane protein [Streptomyces griseoluteus]|uniref:GlsB/YeaQ/YmgE family stress response membrane protein n=1 Tax=Streptomyces griseoluteus TaxID=29306 RepID=A0A4Z1D0J8_STRGP|nr:GlsB/YeaQ/YmgE family stress response membrane protein [Streptomyces griseoluteus]TGN75087.1 GlsB/YeaQ/YmgE family stress response membrane protein [Streptomyces griseoluteus]GHF34549.1 membrane protein [Streptomyces griseoluteus]